MTYYTPLSCEFFTQRFHLGEGVLVAGAVGGGDALVQAGDGGLGLRVGGHGLGGHLVGRHVVGIVGDAAVELGQGFGDTGSRDEFHGEAIAGKGVSGGLLEDLGEEGYFVHKAIVGAFLLRSQAAPAPAPPSTLCLEAMKRPTSIAAGIKKHPYANT